MKPVSAHLLHALIALIVLSGLSALSSSELVPLHPAVIAGVILVLALAKARVILADYLELAHASGWLRGVLWVIALWALAVMGLYLGPLLV